MADIDWSKAPEGATHYHHGSQTYTTHWKKDGCFCVEGFESEGWKDDFDRQECQEYVERPAQEWTGEGLPPVGTVCEVSNGNGTHTGQIKLYDGKQVVIRVTSSGTDYCIGKLLISETETTQFRPVRTQAQIAADLADQEIKKIAAIICRDGAFDIDDPEVAESAVALYDAGLRFKDDDK